MKQFFATALVILMIGILLLTGCAPVSQPADIEPVKEVYSVSVREVNKHGNLMLDTTIEALREKGFEIADMVTVTVGDKSFDMPLATSYSDVDGGEMLLRYDPEDYKIALAINGGNFAETVGAATKETIEETPGYRWNMFVDTVTLTVREKGGYRDEYNVRQLERTNDRADYADLSDRDFANYRAVSATGIRENVLYRGTTPLDTDLARDTYIMTFLEQDGIKAVLNLADTVDEMTSFEAYADSYYADCAIINVTMDYQFASEAFAAKMKDCVLFILANDGPYYVHCKEGKDRTGVFCAILECYFGASYEEVKDDYMKTYLNFYHVTENSDTYLSVLKSSFEKTLCGVFQVEALQTADLQREATEYLLSAGLTEAELASLADKIGK